MRSFEELASTDDPAWPLIEEAIESAAVPVAVLPSERSTRALTLVRLQVTARSGLGALALETGGLLVDHGWLRVLGGGERLLNLATANGLETPPEEPPAQLLVAFDVLGGKYAVNGGGLPGSPGEVCYFAPDELAWGPMEMGHLDFLLWSLTERIEQFNAHLRWPGWEAEVAALRLDQGISVFPFPSTTDGHDLATVSRRPVPISELLTIWDHFAEQVKGIPDGGVVQFHGES
jgi:hypothetical protein